MGTVTRGVTRSVTRSMSNIGGWGGHDADLSLLYQFDKTGSLNATDGLGPTLGITRTTTASYWNSAGILSTAASGAARFDHNPITGESLGLLVEEARTNICLQSEDFSTTWTKQPNTAVNANAETAPDNAVTADRFIDDNGGGTGAVRLTQSITMATNTAYVVSAYLKKDGLDWCRIAMTGLGALSIYAHFDLANAVVGATKGGDNTSEFIEDAGNGWYRCGIVFTSDASDTTGIFNLYVSDGNGDVTVPLDGTSSIFVWGAQLEAGAFPTSYIPTVAASVTRNADVVSTTDTSWMNTEAGTFYNDIRRLAATGILGTISILSDGSINNRFDLIANSTAAGRYFCASGGSGQVDLVSVATPYAAGVQVRQAAAYALNDTELYVDGVRSGTGDQTFTLPTGINKFEVGSRDSSAHVNGHIAEIRYYNVRKPNTFLNDLSNGIIEA